MFDTLDKLISENLAFREQEKSRKGELYQPLVSFRVNKLAKDLIEPARRKAAHHRAREAFYTSELEKSEKELREKGITVEVKDPTTGLMVAKSICSGSISAGGLEAFNQYGNMTTPGNLPKFEPRFDSTLLSIVEKHKTKMLEHRDKTLKYDKWARAFACSPETKVELTVEDVWFFELEGK